MSTTGEWPSGPQNVRFRSNGGEAFGYLALPEQPGPGLIVIQEWWGLTENVQRMTDRFAEAGFVALAPDLYGGSVAHDAEEAAKMMDELPLDRAAQDLAGAVDYLLGREEVTREKVGTVGFCMGGAFVLVLAALRPDEVGAAVPFYPVGPYDKVDLKPVAASVLAHFGADDAWAPPEAARALESRLSECASPHVDIRVHQGAGHAFLNEEGANYHPDLAQQCWNDTVEFLFEHL